MLTGVYKQKEKLEKYIIFLDSFISVGQFLNKLIKHSGVKVKKIK